MRNLQLLFIVLLFFQTTIFAQNEIVTTIKGKIDGGNFSEVMLTDISQEFMFGHDYISENEFVITSTIGRTDIYKLLLAQNFYVILILVPGQNVEIKIDASNAFISEVTGSPDTELLYNTFTAMNQFDKQLDSINNLIDTERRNFIKTIFAEHPQSLANLLFYKELDFQTDYPIIKQVSDSLAMAYPYNMFVNEMNMEVEAASFLSIGTKAPEIILNDKNGTQKKLSDLKGNYVLIDFWASWCAPCRRESPNLVQIYNDFHSKGFEIFGVSFDNNKDNWVKAIEDDKLNWTQVSDLMYWDSPIVQLYNIQGIPFTVLLDKEGNIVAKNLRGEELRSKLEEIFGSEK